uniref:probable gamma-secretase subunit PEN-2 n=1 Tax=Fragaria vesca subsp. vesca TaxID=101020 RepID=UPI0005CB10E0|nr:PREDICTED: probable gamma-secretase subunit PEN-2 [Fragaria vesca subsp. vesca]
MVRGARCCPVLEAESRCCKVEVVEEESVSYAHRFYKFGFALLPLLWAVNCFYFWPALRHSRSFPLIHHYVLRSAVGFAMFTALLSSWALTFGIGGERLFGHVWDELVMYNLADRLGLTESTAREAR